MGIKCVGLYKYFAALQKTICKKINVLYFLMMAYIMINNTWVMIGDKYYYFPGDIDLYQYYK